MPAAARFSTSSLVGSSSNWIMPKALLAKRGADFAKESTSLAVIFAFGLMAPDRKKIGWEDRLVEKKNRIKSSGQVNFMNMVLTLKIEKDRKTAISRHVPVIKGGRW